MKCNDWDPDPLLALGLPLHEYDEICRWWLGGKACRLHNHGACETEGRQSLPEQAQSLEFDSGKVLIRLFIDRG